MRRRRAINALFSTSVICSQLQLPLLAAQEVNPHAGHRHYEQLRQNLSRQAEHLFGGEIDQLSEPEVELIARRLERAAEVTARHPDIEEHVERWWAEPEEPSSAKHLVRCPVCYSNALEIVEGTKIRDFLPEHEFAVIYSADESWYNIDSFGNAFPQKDEERRLALGVILLETDYVMVRYADRKTFVARPAYSVNSDDEI